MRPTIYNFSSMRAPITGIGRYAVELLKGQISNNQPVYAVSNGKIYDGTTAQVLTQELLQTTEQVGHLARSRIGSIPFSRDIFRFLQSRSFSNLAKDLLNSGALYHDINYTPCDRAMRSVTTVYDLSNTYAPETHPKHRVNYMNRHFARLAKSTEAIITISNSVKNELVGQYQISPERIHVTHLAAGQDFRPRSQIACKSVLDKYGVNYKRYFLCVGSVEPRKNLARILDAFLSLEAKTQEEYPLVVAGPLGWKSEALEKRLTAPCHQGRIKRLAFVPGFELPLLYSSALAFVYPSLYEGFGLPLVEAMQSGCPCISSNRGALAEVSAGSTLAIDPEDTQTIANGLSSLLVNSEERSRLSNLGLKRSLDFSWANTSKETQRVYESIK